MTLPADVRPTIGDSTWFLHDRFGMFIHWGIYAMPARHEWVRRRERIDAEAYKAKYFDHFDPDLYDPQKWADAAANAGMKYFVITTKHHDGFCLWDSGLTDFKVTNTPYGKDVLRPMVEAFRSRGLKVGFYHSLIDWHHPDFVIDDNHPLAEHPDREKLNAGRDQKRYIEYLHGQVRELLTQFGPIHIAWFDFSYPTKRDEQGNIIRHGKGREDWDSENLIKMVRELQPGILVDNRLDLEEEWDYYTPEQWQPRIWPVKDGRRVVWEACQTFSGSWGYHRDESTWKSEDMLVQMLINTVSTGGNLLLNVGPTGRGEFDERALNALDAMGRWMHHHSRSIYGCTQAPDDIPAPLDGRYTYNPQTQRLYLHLYAWPFKQIWLDGLAGRIAYAQLLNDGSEVPWHETPADAQEQRGGTVRLMLPIVKPKVTVPVVEIILKR